MRFKVVTPCNILAQKSDNSGSWVVLCKVVELDKRVRDKRGVVVVVVSHIQRIGCQPEKLLYTVANPARGLLNREKRTKERSQAAYPPSPPPTPDTGRSEKNK